MHDLSATDQPEVREDIVHRFGRVVETQPQTLVEALAKFGQGFTVFDSDLNLVLCNGRFLEILEFPPELIRPGVPLAEFFRFNARRGEYGPGDEEAQVAERVAKARRFVPHFFERVRPDGTVIEVRGAPLPGGGFVTMYSDVTVRKRAEDQLMRQTQYLRSVIDNLPQGISVFDEALKLKFWNAKLLDVLELPEDAVYPDVPFEDLIMIPARRGEYGPGDPAAHVQARRELALKFEDHRFERSRPNGRAHLVEGRRMSLGASLIGFVTTYTDITDRISNEQEIRRRNEVLQTLFDNIPGGISLFDMDFRLIAYNAEFKRLLDFPDHLFMGGETNLADLARFNAERGDYGAVEDVDAFVQQMLDRARLRMPHKFERARPNGVVLEIRGVPLPDGGFVSIYTDITERKAAEEEISRLASFDFLTGLANRHSLESRLDQSIAEARRNGSRLALLFLDLDRFKAVNDSLGHAVGDELLIEVSRRLQASIRESDIVARLGGDEFVVVAGNLHDPSDVVVILDKIIAQVAQPILVGPHRLATSTSIGVALFPDDGADRALLMKHADIAMYHAKAAGRGRYQFFDATMNAAVKRRLEIEMGLRRALVADELILHYQPQMRLGDDRVVGVEALVRWRQPDGEIVPPGAFVPLAEELGLIDQLGAWVLRQAVADAARWQRVLPRPISVAVNLSLLQLKTPSFAAHVRRCLAESGLPAGQLTLEITETAAMANPAATIALLEELAAMGVRLAIDDFGTGFSSLTHLKQLPLSYLKLDRAFVKDIETNADSAAICNASIGLAHALGLEVVAEGVEEPGQLAALRALACDHIQGFHLARPMEADQVLDFIGRLG